MPKAHVNGIHLYYEEVGQGLPLGSAGCQSRRGATRHAPSIRL